ncbi:MAG: hypothetical protein ACO326_09495 [Burkholderiaceae bacterium]
MKIVNLTQHAATAEQATAGVYDLQGEALSDLRALLTFDDLPSPGTITARALALAAFAQGCEAAMIGGAPYLMPALEAALLEAGVLPLYAFSRRESVDVPQEDGSIRKTAVFRHLGFVQGALIL